MGEPPEDPFAPLVAVHEDFVDKLTELEATLDEMMATRETREGNDIILDEAVRFFREKLIPPPRVKGGGAPPAMEKGIGGYGPLVTVVMYEQEKIRRGVLNFEEAGDALRPAPPFWQPTQKLNRH